MLEIVDQLAARRMWWFRFTLASQDRDVFLGGREFLPPIAGSSTAWLVVGADDGQARNSTSHTTSGARFVL
jgi:hypothetical protein